MHKGLLTLTLITTLVAAMTGCSTTTVPKDSGDITSRENRAFLAPSEKTEEAFRVLLTSDNYMVAQMKHTTTMNRTLDPGGDKYMIDEVKKLDKIDEVREGVFSVWLFPDSGRIMKIRTQKPTYLLEVDKLISEDIQRWNFDFPAKTIDPTKIDIKYRVVLRKKLTDAEIIREVQDNMREQH